MARLRSYSALIRVVNLNIFRGTVSQDLTRCIRFLRRSVRDQQELSSLNRGFVFQRAVFGNPNA